MGFDKVLFGYLIIMMSACNHKIQLINLHNIKLIEITHYLQNNETIIIKITSYKKIKCIVDQVNQAEREPVVFKAEYTLKVVYDNGLNKLIICNSNLIKVDGLSYKIKRKISEMIDQ